MGNQYFCEHKQRRTAVSLHPTLNGIDYLEVLDLAAPSGSPRQRTLLVHCLKPIPALTKDNVRIEGGVRITPVLVEWAHRADTVPPALVNAGEQALLAALAQPDHVLVVRTDASGDYDIYRLRLTASASAVTPPPNFDPLLSDVPFTFKVECPSDFDCRPAADCPPEQWPEPIINYLAKDYASFRQLVLDRLAIIMPDWQERNPADLGIVLVELLAYAADHLSYYQDAVATEAYLDTARKRVSVRRHAKLLDYHMHEGSNSRTWVSLTVTSGSAADNFTLPAGTKLLTQINAPRGSFDPVAVNEQVLAKTQVFETMHALTLRAGLNEITFYTWGDEDCCLPKGATRATLHGSAAALPLEKGDLLLFEAVRGTKTGHSADADRAHRHVVRLSQRPHELVDPLTNETVLDITWHVADALPFPLCLWQVDDSAGTPQPVAVARGNVLLADAGLTINDEALLPATAPTNGRYRPQLQQADITHWQPYQHQQAVNQAAAQALAQDLRQTLAAARLKANGAEWQAQPDLLNSDRFAADFVTEVDENGRGRLRFGDNALGKEPTPGAAFTATYRTGNGRATNIGAETIAHVVTDRAGITNARNPLPAQGGTDPEPVTQVKLYAPQAFRTQKRAVTPADYAAAAERHAQVQKAEATLRWTGSWHTVFVTVDRIGGLQVDAFFEDELRDYLGHFRLAGHDLEIEPPRFVPLDVALRVCVNAGVFRDVVETALRDVFSRRDLPDGRRGFFHPDNLTFGQTVYLSQMITAAMNVPGVNWVEPLRFQRWGALANDEIEQARLRLARLEIPRLDNDVNRPENGRIEFVMEGGL